MFIRQTNADVARESSPLGPAATDSRAASCLEGGTVVKAENVMSSEASDSWCRLMETITRAHSRRHHDDADFFHHRDRLQAARDELDRLEGAATAAGAVLACCNGGRFTD